MCISVKKNNNDEHATNYSARIYEENTFSFFQKIERYITQHLKNDAALHEVKKSKL